jgi:hypothetical protein
MDRLAYGKAQLQAFTGLEVVVSLDFKVRRARFERFTDGDAYTFISGKACQVGEGFVIEKGGPKWDWDLLGFVPGTTPMYEPYIGQYVIAWPVGPTNSRTCVYMFPLSG